MESWHIQQAEEMLTSLTYYDGLSYQEPGHGGKVTRWQKATFNHHFCCLERLINSDDWFDNPLSSMIALMNHNLSLQTDADDVVSDLLFRVPEMVDPDVCRKVKLFVSVGELGGCRCTLDHPRRSFRAITEHYPDRHPDLY